MDRSKGFDLVADILPVGVLRADPLGACVFLNRAGRDLLGLSPGEGPETAWTRGLPGPQRDALVAAWARATEAGEPFSTELDVRGADGEPRTVTLRSVPTVDGAGRVSGHLAALVDVTESRRTGIALQRSARELEQRVRASEQELRDRMTHLTRVSTMGEMASSIAHEVNQPLTAVATYAQACRRLIDAGEADLADVRDVLARIAREALRAGDIIHRLKDLVRRHETRWAECDLNALIRDVEPLARVDARHHDVGLVLQLGPDLPPLLADAVQVQQVVLNLVRNGIDAVEEARPPERWVTLRTGLDGPRTLRVSVEDSGAGVTEAAEAHLFQPFFTTKKGGMGMGLSISRSIVRAHHGRIGFQRRREGGSTFFFTLPALDDS
jgi:PAS domain S-box-containing protein